MFVLQHSIAQHSYLATGLFMAFVGLLFFGSCWPFGLYQPFWLLDLYLPFGFCWPFGLYQPLWHVWFYPAVDKVKLISNFTKQSYAAFTGF